MRCLIIVERGDRGYRPGAFLASSGILDPNGELLAGGYTLDPNVCT